MNIDLRLGDCIEVMRTLPDNSVDSVITDPPYHLTSSKGSSKGFMNKEWDGGDIAFRTEVWTECLRVLKPGGYLLSFSSPRTYHRMAVAIEDAGFEIRDQISWIFGSGFPKSHNIGKAIDKIQGNEREVVRTKHNQNDIRGGSYAGENQFNREHISVEITKGQSEWEGWGSALKPAFEPICMARKPLSEKSIAENVLKWGTGGINIDGCRIPFDMTDTNPATNPLYRQENNYKMPEPGQESNGAVSFTSSKNEISTEGRFPANLILECICDETSIKQAPKSGHWSKTTTTGFGEFGNGSSTYEGVGEKESGNMVIHTNPDCPCYVLDQQSGISITGASKPKKKYDGGNLGGGNAVKDYPSSKGGASRFFYSSKVSKKERGEGNVHPTVKPKELMKYLIKMITPPNGVVLEPFLGSGSTGVAAKELGFVSTFIGIEKEEEYMEIAKKRIDTTID